MTDRLATYRKMRDFQGTTEPRGASADRAAKRLAYVVQEHHARRLHYDFRLELGGVLLSWAVPKGPSEDPSVKRLAVRTEDHPFEYRKFAGTIPDGHYGAGKVEIWDEGEWEPEGDPHAGMKKGHLAFTIHGKRLSGRYHLVRARRGDEKKEPWLLFRGSDVEDSKTKAKRASKKKLEPRAASPKAADDHFPAIEPELALLVKAIPKGDDWIHEVKYDGYRIFAKKDGARVTLLSRNGKDWTSRMPAIAEAVSTLAPDTLLLDGEVVVLDAHGVSDFQLLQNALGTGDGELVYYAFDLLYASGKDTRAIPIEQRKEALASVVSKDGLIRYSDHLEASGERVLARACKLGLEGIVSKRRGSSYAAGRGGDWQKTKCGARQEMIIGGFTDPKGGRSRFGALLVGTRDHRGGPLRYAGKVGTGFDDRTLEALWKKLTPLRKADTPFTDPPTGADARGVHWVEPDLVAEVSYLAFTRGGKLRHPSFVGLREDKDARVVVRERAAT
ncbi:hypothetical protein BH09MYX1_BH09MYX1_52310 [soil metagenome]